MDSTGSTVKNFSSSERKCFFLEINPEVPSYVFAINIVTSAVNGVSSLVAITANLLVIVAIWRNPSLHTASNVLLSCLAFSDLIVGLVSQPAYIAYKVGETRGKFHLLCFAQLVAELTGWTASGVSFLTLTAIGLERYISLFRPLNYHAIVTVQRALAVVVSFWLLFVFLEVARFWFLDSKTSGYVIIVLITVCLSVSFWAYWKVYNLACRHQNSVRDIAHLKARLHGTNAPVATQRDRKAAYAMLGVFILVLISYFPMMCSLAAFQVAGFTTPLKAALNVSSTTAMVNSCLNPLWYCWRIRDIRREIWKLLFKSKRTEGSSTGLSLRVTYRKSGAFEQSRVSPRDQIGQ